LPIKRLFMFCFFLWR